VADRRRKWWKVILIVLAMLVFWTFIVCFPNPFIFIRNEIRYFRPPIDPSVIELIETAIPDESAKIEKFVMALVKYENDWKTYGVPDYVSTPRQAVTRRRGDCEDRAIVLASVFEAKNIPYSLKASLSHYWVDYSGKKPNSIENENVAVFGKVDGKYKLKLPGLNQLRRYLKNAKKGGWDVMPTFRKVLMISGWVLIVFSGYLLRRGRKVVIRASGG
jgi:hypothetical protein